MTSILNLSGLNYGASNPLRGEMNIIRDYIARVEKTVKELAAGGGGGGAEGNRNREQVACILGPGNRSRVFSTA